ncbi:MAG: efflux RND transporter periplasmic adaptor subunit [Nitrospiraceae bacterium]
MDSQHEESYDEPSQPKHLRKTGPRFLWPIGLTVVLAIMVSYALLHREAPTQQAQSGDVARPAVSTDTAPSGTNTAAPASDTAAIDPTPVDVQVTQPIRQPLAYTITLPANIAPLYQTTLYAKVSGYLKWIGPDKGDRVKKNQVLAIIDAPEVEEQYQQAHSDYTIKKLTFERLSKVWRESPDVIAKQDVDLAEAAYQGARHSREQRSAFREYTKVRAPYDGVITARFADPGALIQVATSSATNAIPLFTVMDLDTVRAYANVPQDDAAWIQPGTTATTLTVKDMGGRSYTAPITRSTLALDPSTRSLLVEVDLPNRDYALRPGTYAEMTIALREIPEALTLPSQAVTGAAKGKSVFIVENGKAKSISVQTGITDGKMVEITQGLQGTEDVVVVGKRRLLEGSLVSPSPFKLPPAKPAQQKFERRSAGASPPPPAAAPSASPDKPAK